MKNILIGLSIIFASITYGQNIIQPNDLNILLGDWEGNLTYVDYGTQKPFTMPANLSVKKGKNDYQVSLFINYPKEPNANSRDKIKISKDGKKINKIDITSVERLSNGQIIVTSEYLGKDNSEKAQIRYIYSLSKNEFTIRKEVNFEDSTDWMMRNEYRYAR